MIRHILLVKVEGDAATVQLESALEQIGQVVDRLPAALSFAYGPSNSPEQLERGYSYGHVGLPGAPIRRRVGVAHRSAGVEWSSERWSRMLME